MAGKDGYNTSGQIPFYISVFVRVFLSLSRSYHNEEEYYLLRRPTVVFQPSAVLREKVDVREPLHRQRSQVDKRCERPPQFQPLQGKATK